VEPNARHDDEVVAGIVGGVEDQLQIGCDRDRLRDLDAVEDLEEGLVAEAIPGARIRPGLSVLNIGPP
jgi:hypothetical protein